MNKFNRKKDKLKGVFMGLDIGKKIDYTVLSIIEKHQEYVVNHLSGETKKLNKPVYHLVDIIRLPLDVPHNKQMDAVKKAYKNAKEYYNQNLQLGEPKKKLYLIIDLGNVGESHFDDYLQTGLNVYGVKAHSGEQARFEKRRWYVSKENICNSVEILLDHKRLIIADNIPDKKGLIKELARFTWKKTNTGKLTAENLRDVDHDDRVDSVSAALWFAQHGVREIKAGERIPGL